MNYIMNSTLPSIPPPPHFVGACPNASLFNVISTTSGSLAFISSMVAQFPQLIETYRDKTVEGISELLLLSWLGGDITSLIGALLTNQLPFQIILAIYFLANDIIICGQFYYYGIFYKNRLATPGHQHLDPQHQSTTSTTTTSNSTTSSNRKTLLAVILGFFTRSASAMPIPKHSLSFSPQDSSPQSSSTSQILSTLGLVVSMSSETNQRIGALCSWAGGLFYFCSRIPQLLKNYERKSTDGVSPLLFYCTIFHNITYGISIFTSCQFVYADSKWDFFKNEAPFLLGSVGTLLFDFIYLYQHCILYSEDTKLRQKLSENARKSPISSKSSNTQSQPTETSPLLSS